MGPEDFCRRTNRNGDRADPGADDDNDAERDGKTGDQESMSGV
ncbi:hypothetical protein [Kribbella deserti]|uniref:Uncharacterized protein n=1 Tax=Kribbella deserti TaxID=1926257 RepID=A0ABV6QFR2_9ACTN